MALALRILTTLVLCSSGGQTLAAQAGYETTRIADGVYQFRWQAHNGFFVATPAGVLAVDPISMEAAAQYAEEIRKVAPDAPLRAIVYSHEDADHATGAPALMSAMGVSVPIIAQRNAVAAGFPGQGQSQRPPRATIPHAGQHRVSHLGQAGQRLTIR